MHEVVYDHPFSSFVSRVLWTHRQGSTSTPYGQTTRITAAGVYPPHISLTFASLRYKNRHFITVGASTASTTEDQRLKYSNCREINDLSSIRLLSLSHIFPVNKFCKNECLASYLGNNVSSVFKGLAYKNSSLKKASNKPVLYVKELLDCYNDDKSITSVTFVPGNEQEEGLLKVCQKFISFGANIHEKSEANFMNHYLMPFLYSIILEETDESIVYSMVDGSDAKKRKKPDFMLGIKDKKRELYYFYVEVKRPKLKLGMKEPKSFGLLCEGFSCSLYKMTILEEGIYASSCLRRFQLVENLSMILNVVPATEVFIFLKEELQSLQDRYKSRSKKETKDLQKLIKPSFITKFNK
ncbi:unnamed protein product [Mucor circinelloides]